MRQIVKDYVPIVDLCGSERNGVPEGFSLAPKSLIFHILENNFEEVDVLDVGFGVGQLGELVKNEVTTNHWCVDGVDGWEPNCYNVELIKKKFYRNIWHGLAQNLSSDLIRKYRIICILDVLEHLNIDTAKWLLRTLISLMDDSAYIFISCPLWFAPQDPQQHGDLEEHMIGIPITSMMGLMPVRWSISNQFDCLMGGFVYGKESLKYIDFFQPTTNKNFTHQMGLNMLQMLSIRPDPEKFYRYDGPI